MKPQPNQRAVILGRFILENKSTVRAAAKKFGISKSTVHTVIQKENGIWIRFKCRFLGVDKWRILWYNKRKAIRS